MDGENITKSFVEGYCSGYEQGQKDLGTLINIELDVLNKKNYSGVALYDFARNVKRISNAAAGSDY